MIIYKTAEEIELMRQAAQLVSRTLGEIAKIIKPGVTGLELDKLAEQYIAPCVIEYRDDASIISKNPKKTNNPSNFHKSGCEEPQLFGFVHEFHSFDAVSFGV